MGRPMSGRGANVRGGIVVMAQVARASSSDGVVVMGADGAPVSCLLEDGRPEPLSPLEAV
jgi:hypothetical protein